VGLEQIFLVYLKMLWHYWLQPIIEQCHQYYA